MIPPSRYKTCYKQRYKVIGVDLGISRLAVTSHPRFFGGKHVKETNNRSFRLRRSLQSKGTESAKRHLKKVSGRVARFQKNVNHVVAKQLVSSVQAGDTLVMENLTDIRERTNNGVRSVNNDVNTPTGRLLNCNPSCRTKRHGRVSGLSL